MVEIISKSNYIDAMRVLMQDRVLMIQTLLMVEDKSRKMVPFFLGDIQMDMIQTSGIADIYVKPAQVGASTVHIADYMLDVLTIPGTTAVIISYNEFITGRLLRKANNFYHILSKRVPGLPEMDHNSTYEMTFPGINGSFYIGSAGSFTFGRGEKIDDLLLDEYGFWKPGDAERIFSSALQRVPLLPHTKRRILSTPNGEDNDFCETFRAAEEGTSIGASIFKPHFYPWFLHKEYRLGIDNPFTRKEDREKILKNLDADEAKLVEQFKLDYDQIRWRRYKIAEMASLRRTGESSRLFGQEYPEDKVTCFMSVGDQAHSPDIIAEKSRQCYPAIDCISVLNPKNGIAATAMIWEKPNGSYNYLLSVDPGKGKSSESVGHIWRFTEGYEDSVTKLEVPPRIIHCATVSGLYDEWEMAEYVKSLARVYNNAMIAPEDNLDLVSHLRTYRNLYYREDLRDGKITRAVGWQTNGSTKPYMISEINRQIEYIECHDIRFWQQCKNIRRDKNNKTGYSVVGSTDHYMAGGIGICCRESLPTLRGYMGNTGTTGWDDSWGR